MILNTLIFMMPSQPGQGGSGMFGTVIWLLMIMVVFYLFFIRPQTKKANDQRKFREALKKGDRVITIGGIHGKIVEVQDTTFTIEVENGVRLRMEKSAIASGVSDQLPA